MARKIARLTTLDVRRAKRRGMLHDGGGLYLSIAANGSKSWIFRYGAGGRRHLGLGATHSVDLAEARERARQARVLLIDGKDPIAERRAQRAAQRLAEAKSITFAEAAATYIRDHHAAWRNAKNRKQWEHTLRTYAAPINNLPVAEIDTGLVLQCVEGIWREKTETASRVRRRIERVLAWATTHGYRAGPNPAAWSDHLANLLPAAGKIAPVEHHPALPFADVPGFVQELHSRHGVAPLALEFLILTAARTSEVLGADWSEFKLDEAVWTVPAGRMKAAKEHRVPLARRAVEILRALPRTGAGGPFRLSDVALRQLLRRMKRTDITPHGFRSSFRDWCSEVAGASREIAEMALAHSVGSQVEAAYRRGDLLAKRRRLMDDWARYCAGQTLAAKVMPLHG